MQRVYLDTTVPSAYIDARAPDRQRLTEEFWLERLPTYEPLISALVIAEVRDTPDAAKCRRLEALVQSFTVLPVTLRTNRHRKSRGVISHAESSPVDGA